MSARSFFLLSAMVWLTGANALGFTRTGVDGNTSINIEDTTSVMLKEIKISAGFKSPRSSPLRLSSIDQDFIKDRAHGLTYPELLKEIPGVYSTAETGSYGDAKINIRGFKNENISVLLNGVPISGLTSGSMFWNNWVGLADATSAIQVQKGIGASMLSDNSVGGSINIITKSPAEKSYYDFNYSLTSYGLSKAGVNYSSGEIGNGWGVMLSASYTWGKSYIECSDVNSGAYLLSISKKFNKKHSLLFTALGSPERHQQRSQRLSYDEVEKFGVGYSKNWGIFTDETGKVHDKTISENNYFRPYFTLNHFFTDNKNITVNTAAYIATGNGGGIWTESKGRRLISYQKDGHIDWDSIIAENKELAAEGKSASNILSDYLAGNTQYGITSNLTWKVSKSISLEYGAHYQHYTTWEKEKITDLLGGDHWFEDYENKSLAGTAGREPRKGVGDYIRTYNGKKLNYFTLYQVFNYTTEKLVLNIGLSLNSSFHRRWDRYNYTAGNEYSETAKGVGGSFKGGVLYKASRSSSFYLNAAAYSRVPYTSVFFASGNNRKSENVKNEKNILGESGYRFVTDKGAVEATFYAAYWFNKSIMSNPYKPLEEDAYKFMITGLNAFHFGVEIDAHYNLTDWMKISGYASIGSWKWKNNVSASIYDPYTGQVAAEVHVYSDGLPVGDAPQTQLGADTEFKPFRSSSHSRIFENLALNLQWSFADRYWADFDPDSRTVEGDAKPYRIPSYNLINGRLSESFKLKNCELSLYFSVNNIFNTRYITRGKDGSGHNRETFTGYWGAKRNCIFGIGFRF